MKFKFTTYSFVNALLSLIPIFPVWLVIPGVLAAMGIEKMGGSCEQSYIIVFWFCVSLSLILMVNYLISLPKLILKKTEKDIKFHFRIFNLLMYTLINTALMIKILGIYYCCHGDGQSILVVMFSGPITSVILIVIGFIIDFTNFRQSRRVLDSE